MSRTVPYVLTAAVRTCDTMILTWDSDRYDYISVQTFFLVTWNIWDHSGPSRFANVLCFSFLSGSDLQNLCWTCYGIYIDRPDILIRLDEYGNSSGLSCPQWFYWQTLATCVPMGIPNLALVYHDQTLFQCRRPPKEKRVWRQSISVSFSTCAFMFQLWFVCVMSVVFCFSWFCLRVYREHGDAFVRLVRFSVLL